ncbi:FHA domain-containing protein [Olsenella uli]|uniref:FHA domain-containing protein n=1 Tax=Olsenella uli TaxID=133926 RepID=UPI00195AB17C|nr:FHA domain-containing protein [Olsenella uli]
MTLIETPSSYMFSDLRKFGRLTNRDAAQELLSATVTYGGKAPRMRITDRTFLSRQIVHALPGQTHPELFADFFQSSQTLTSRIIANRPNPVTAREEVRDHYCGEAALGMQQVLRDFDLDDTLYANAISRIAAAKFRTESDRTVLYVMLFLATGCLADPQRAVSIVERFVEYKLAMDIGTVEMDVGAEYEDRPGSERDEVVLGLLRISGDTARPPIHPLATTDEGTLVGSLADGESVINDVDVDVSRRHLRIWRDGARWYAQGLGSTNGTMLIPGDGTDPVVIEPPRAKRAHDGSYPPVEISNSDVLCLGATTRFLVMRITS